MLAWFSYVADDRQVIVSNHSRREFTKDFTHEQSPTIVIAYVGNIWEQGLITRAEVQLRSLCFHKCFKYYFLIIICFNSGKNVLNEDPHILER